MSLLRRCILIAVIVGGMMAACIPGIGAMPGDGSSRLTDGSGTHIYDRATALDIMGYSDGSLMLNLWMAGGGNGTHIYDSLFARQASQLLLAAMGHPAIPW